MSSTSRNASPDAFFVRNRILLIAVCAVLLTAPVLYSPWATTGPVLCPLHGIVGLPCPGCGLTRAFCALWQGRWIDALAYNALSVPLVILVVVAPWVAACELLAGRRAAFYGFLYSSRFAWLAAAVVISYQVGRVGWWLADGSLMTDYVQTSWTYAMLK